MKFPRNLPTPSDIPSVKSLDDAVDAWCRDHRHPVADRVFYGLSSAADHSLLWNILVAARGVRNGQPSMVLRGAAVFGIESALTNGALKSLFNRERPAVEEDADADAALPMGMRRPVTSSFPSGHATAAFTAAALLSQDSKHPGVWYALAALVAGSRVYTRMHHASDVLAGAALGAVFGAVAIRVLPLSTKRR